MRVSLLGLVACTTAAVACASKGSSGTRAGTPSASAAASQGGNSWSGNFVPTQQRTGNISGGGQARAFGTVTLTVSQSDPNRTRARLTLDAPAPSRALPWAILSGRCGSGTLPLIGHELFPAIEVSSNGRGQLDTELPMELPTAGQLHVNVYWQGQTLDQVMTCANLRHN